MSDSSLATHITENSSMLTQFDPMGVYVSLKHNHHSPYISHRLIFGHRKFCFASFVKLETALGPKARTLTRKGLL